MQSGDPTGDSLYYPVLQGVSPLPALPSLSGVKTQTINPYTWGTAGGHRSTPGSTATSSGDDAAPRQPGRARVTATRDVLVPGPAPAGPGTPRWRRLAAPRGLTALFGRLGLPLFWAAADLVHPGPLRQLRWCWRCRPGCSTRARSGSPCTTCGQAFTGATAIAITNSLWVSARRGRLGLAIGFPIAWLAGRTTLPGRRFVAGGMWLVLLLPSWLPALGWERLVQPDGVMYRVGLNWPWVTHAIMGPFGVVLLLGLRSVPFTFLAITAALAGLGPGVRGRGPGARRGPGRHAAADLADAGPGDLVGAGHRVRRVDQRLRGRGHAGLQLELQRWPPTSCYAAIDNFPPSFPARLGHGHGCWSRPSRSRSRCRRARCAAGPTQMLSGRTRQVVRRQLSRQAALAAVTGVGLFYLVALGIPGFGAVSASLLGDYGGSFNADPGQLPGAAARDRADRPAGTLADLRRGHLVSSR